MLTTISQNQVSKKTSVSFARSQLILFQSRMKWGVVYCLATIAGLFFVPGTINVMASEVDAAVLIQRIMPLPLISLLITTGMFLLNDILDIELDMANGKKRPLPSGQVTKAQGWIFIAWTNVAAVLLSIVTGNPASMLLVVPMLAIGLMYSAPKIALDDKFVIKTLVIAIYYVLCATLGFTSIYGIDLAISNPLMPIFAAALLGGMRFISSVLNDTGDVDGDKAAGRRTIPIVIGRANTIKMEIGIAIGMATISLLFYASGNIGPTIAIMASSIAALLAVRLVKTLKGVDDREFVRAQHKKMLPFDLLFLASLVAGTFMI